MTRSSRDLQPFLRGLGRHFVSPTKRARGHIANQMPVQFLGRDLQLQALRRRLQGLIDSPGAGSSSPALDPFAEPSSDAFQDTSCPPSSDPPSGVDASDAPSTSAATTPKKKRYRQPAPLTAQRLYGRWTGLLPLLATPLLEYLQRSAGRPVASTFTPMHMCLTGMCMVVHQDMNLLFWDHYDTISVPFCECNPLPNVLVASGMFPTSPTLPRTAVSIDLLDLYLSLFERSGDAVTALARAIRQFYTKRGWRILDHKGEPLTDPFRKPLGHAVQWYDSLRVLVERDIDRAIDKARRIVTDHLKPPVHRASSSDPTSDDTSIISPVATCAPPVASSSEIPFTKKHRRRSRKVANAATLEVSLSELISPFVPEQPPEPRTTCDPVLQRRCPACFGGETFGQSFADGADIAVAVDGNFSHRHMRKAGDKPAFYDPEYFLPKVFVDAVGTWIGQQRQKPPKPDYVPKVPDAAVDSCQHGHEAANEEKAKTDPERFDDTGVMALVCSHDIPILMANIDTPGEQQKYAISLILWLFLLLPDNATVAGLYDIGCTTDRSINLYDLLPAHIVSRLVWAVSVMHAYGHEWVCQLVYNPRLAPGLGLRDGEGVERLWSCLRVLIPVTRTSARSRRIWILDRQVRAIGDEMRDHLGAWITRKLKDGVWAQYTEAKKIVVDSQISVAELRHQWAMQQEAQLSIRAHAPSRLKKGVEAVLALQAEIEHVDEAIADVMKKFKENLAMPDSVTILQALQFLSADLSQRAESLYGSLNVSDVFPELKDVHADFVRTLVLARDIKLNVRKRVTAQLLEFDRIDQAAGGKDNPLGTKLHQYTRRSIARRQPAIRSTIQKFNRYVQKLQDLAVTHSIADTIPIPRPLSTDVNELRNDPDFYEDVWVYPASGNDKPRWLHEQGTRLAIRALLKMERCVEEESRLHRELDHMCWWLGREIAITQLALQMVDNSLYRPIIQHRLDNLTLLQRMWANPLDKTSRLLSQVTWAQSIVEDILQTSDGLLYQPIQDAAPVVATFTQLGDDEDDDDNVQDDFANRGLDLLEVIDFLEVLEHEDESASEDSQSEGEEIDDAVDLPEETQDHLAAISVASDNFESDSESDLEGPESQSNPAEASGGASLPVRFIWRAPDLFSSHIPAELHTATFPIPSTYIPVTRYLPRISSSTSVVIEPSDYKSLINPAGLLNSDCINGCAVLLQRHLASRAARPCAIFSTWDIIHANTKDDGGALARSLRHSAYRERDIWIVPVHRPGVVGHWTLVTIDLCRRTFFHFDSFADATEWKCDIRHAARLLAAVSTIGSVPVPSGPWCAIPMTTSAVQTNGHDCGVWVLATIAARLCGFDKTGLQEHDIPDFRKYLCHLITQIPECPSLSS